MGIDTAVALLAPMTRADFESIDDLDRSREVSRHGKFWVGLYVMSDRIVSN